MPIEVVRAGADFAEAGDAGFHERLNIRSAAIVTDLICADATEQVADSLKTLERFG